MSYAQRFVVIIVGAASIVPSAAAALCTPGPSSNGEWYATVASNPMNANRAASVNIQTNTLAVLYDGVEDEGAGDFVTQELWYEVNSTGTCSSSSLSCAYWVEVGVGDGGIDCGSVHDQIFWADNRDGGGYNEHCPNVGWSLGSTYTAEVQWAGVSCAWNVFFGGVNLGTSTSNCGGATRGLQAGLESTLGAPVPVRGTLASGGTLENVVSGTLSGFTEEDNNNNVTQSWEKPFFSNDDCPASIQFVSGSGDSETEESLN
jgi:hypothetical protein